MKKNLLFILTLLVCFSCEKEMIKEEPCPDSERPFESLINSLLTDSTIVDERSIDLLTHEYKFILHVDGTVCKIGYQGQPGAREYEVQIEDSDGQILLNQVMSFSSDEIEYVDIPDLEIEADKEYILRRTILSGNGNADDVVGRIISFRDSPTSSLHLDLPIRFDIMTITEVQIYGTGGPHRAAIPYIDFGFERK